MRCTRNNPSAAGVCARKALTLYSHIPGRLLLARVVPPLSLLPRCHASVGVRAYLGSDTPLLSQTLRYSKFSTISSGEINGRFTSLAARALALRSEFLRLAMFS